MVVYPLKPLFWVASSREDLRCFPAKVRREVGFALFRAQQGGKHPNARPLKGFGGAGVLEIITNFDRSTYRSVYTIRFPDAVYVLHAFQKKARSGKATPRAELERIRTRLRRALLHHAEWSRPEGTQQ